MTNSNFVRLIKIPNISDDCMLCFAQTPDHIPFEIKRIYHISQAKPNLPRGFHAHYRTEQILFCIQGSVRMVIDDGKKREEIILNEPGVGVFLDKLIWHEMHDLTKDAILLVLASRSYEAEDYIRNYERFLEVKKNGSKKD